MPKKAKLGNPFQKRKAVQEMRPAITSEQIRPKVKRKGVKLGNPFQGKRGRNR